MTITALIVRLQRILEVEGDIQVELPDGTLINRVQAVTRKPENDRERIKLEEAKK